jgi:four helix bundle protein
MSEREKRWSGVIGPHGGYRNLKSYQNAEIVYDATVAFCNRFVDRRSRTNDQMVQAARSGKQNIAEGSMASGTSRKTELKLVSVARASLEELLLDYQDFLRQNGLPLWEKDHPKATEVRKLVYKTNRSYATYKALCGRQRRGCRQRTHLPDSPGQLLAGPAVASTRPAVS